MFQLFRQTQNVTHMAYGQLNKETMIIRDSLTRFAQLGWVDSGTSTGVKSGFVYFHEKNGKRQQKFFGQVTF
jgi:hypothetical protein